MKIAVCDDEKAVRGALVQKIRQLGNQDEITELEDARALSFSAVGQFEVIFLDIEMPGINGMEFVERLRDRQAADKVLPFGSLPLIIFVTGYQEYMGKAFSVSAFDFLTKPVQEESLRRVYERARQFVNSRADKESVIKIKSAGEYYMVAPSEIKYVESCNRKNIVHFKDGRKLEYYGTMSELEQKLPGNFFRIHKGYLVNMAYLVKYDRTSVTLQGKEELMMSKYRYPDFVKAYMEYLE